MVVGIFLVHLEGCKNHMKPVAGTCVPSGKCFFQFMVDNMCAISCCVYLGENFGGDFWGWWLDLGSFGGKHPEARWRGLGPPAVAAVTTGRRHCMFAVGG